MRKFQEFIFATMLSLVVTIAGTAFAQPTIDGNVSGADGYGAALSIQNTRTHFGDASSSDPVQTRADSASGGGSEIDQVFGKIVNDRLYVTVTGNLENNFNKLVVFVDSVSGGVNTLDSDVFSPEDNNVPFGLDAFCCGGFTPPNGGNTDNVGALQRMDGLTLDVGFDADYALIFSHGQENVAGTDFWALNSHYADLTNGTAGDVVAAGIVLAPQGLPNVLRVAGDGLSDTPASIRDANDNTQAGASDTTLIGPTLPGLAPGQLIDRDYALSANGGCTDDTGAGCVAPELEFVLNIDPAEVGGGSPNASNHRNFNNTVDLQVAIDNSNTTGVLGSGGPFELVPGEDDPENVVTGIEFSIPLAHLGNATGDIRLTAFVNGSNSDFVSNQFAGVGSLQGFEGGNGDGGNASDLSGVDLSSITGDQFVTIAAASAADADFNGDGDVDGADFLIWQRGFGTSGTLTEGDADASGIVDGADLAIWEGQFGAASSLAATGAVPEPTSAVLLVLGALGIAVRRRV